MSNEQKQIWKDRGIGALFAFTASLIVALITTAPDRAVIALHSKDIPVLQTDVAALKVEQGKDGEHWIEIQRFMERIEAKLPTKDDLDMMRWQRRSETIKPKGSR